MNRLIKYISVMIHMMLILIVSSFINCKEKPQSASSDSSSNIERTITESNVNEPQNLSFDVQLRLLMREVDSITPLSKNNQPADSQASLETEITRLSASLFMENDPEKIFNAIAALLFDKLKITFEKNENDPDAIFPYKIIESRRGTCLGISLMVLYIGEKLGFPLHGVLVPGHFFVRFDDGTVKRNFEPLRHGENMPEQWYRQKWPTRDTVRYSFRNYTKNEVMGVVCYAIGNSMLAKKKYTEAVHYFDKARSKIPEFIEVAGNEAVAYDNMGQTEKALTILGELVKNKSTLDRIHSRYAPLLLKNRRYGDAESEYILALNDEPQKPDLHYGYAMTLFMLKKCESASDAISRALDIQPDYVGANRLKTQILQQCGH